MKITDILFILLLNASLVIMRFIEFDMWFFYYLILVLFIILLTFIIEKTIPIAKRKINRIVGILLILGILGASLIIISTTAT